MLRAIRSALHLRPLWPAAQNFVGAAGDFALVAATQQYAQVKMAGVGGRPEAYFVVQHAQDDWFVISEDRCDYGN